MARNVARKPKKASEESDAKAKKKKGSSSAFKALVTEDGQDFIPFEEAEDKSTDEEFEQMGLPRSFTPEASDDEFDELGDGEGYEVDEGEEDEEEKEEDRVDWGKKLKNYYVDESDESYEEALEDRIAEAEEIAEEMYENVEEEDAELDRYEASEQEEDGTALDTLIENLAESLKRDSEKVELPADFFALSDQEKRAFLDREHPEFMLLLREFRDKSELSSEQIFKLLGDPSSFKFCTKDGLEYLDIRNELFLMYLSYLTYYLLLKVHGISIEKHPVIDRLLEIRLLLDKAKPIENKLQYQISKLLNNVKSKEEENLVPRLDNMEIGSAEGKKYRAPKNIINQPFTEQEREEEGSERYKFMKKMHEIEEFEMEHMRRIPLTKKYKKYMNMMDKKQKGLIGASLQDLTSFTREKPRPRANAADLNLAAQKLRQSVISSEKRNNPDLLYRPKSKPDRAKREGRVGDDKARARSQVGDRSEPGNRSEGRVGGGKGSKRRAESDPAPDEVDRIRGKFRKLKEERRERQQQQVRVYRPQETTEGKREIGKDIMKNRGLVARRSKTQGNARVSNRRKFEKKMKVFNAMTSRNRVEARDYAGEETGINANRKKSLNA